MTESRNAVKQKAKEVKPVVEECIRAGLDFSKTKKELKSRGIHYPNLAKTFYTWQQAIFPENARTEALSSLSEKRKAKEEKSILSVISPKSWSKQKQKEVDESVISDVLNEALFNFIPCPNKNLKTEDVKEINVGGSITGLVVYYTDINLNHPLVVFVLRAIMLVIKVRAMCYKVQEKVGAIQNKVESLRKGDWHEPAPPEK